MDLLCPNGCLAKLHRDCFNRLSLNNLQHFRRSIVPKVVAGVLTIVAIMYLHFDMVLSSHPCPPFSVYSSDDKHCFLSRASVNFSSPASHSICSPAEPTSLLDAR